MKNCKLMLVIAACAFTMQAALGMECKLTEAQGDVDNALKKIGNVTKELTEEQAQLDKHLSNISEKGEHSESLNKIKDIEEDLNCYILLERHEWGAQLDRITKDSNERIGDLKSALKNEKQISQKLQQQNSDYENQLKKSEEFRIQQVSDLILQIGDFKQNLQKKQNETQILQGNLQEEKNKNQTLEQRVQELEAKLLEQQNEKNSLQNRYNEFLIKEMQGFQTKIQTYEQLIVPVQQQDQQ